MPSGRPGEVPVRRKASGVCGGTGPGVSARYLSRLLSEPDSTLDSFSETVLLGFLQREQKARTVVLALHRFPRCGLRSGASAYRKENLNCPAPFPQRVRSDFVSPDRRCLPFHSPEFLNSNASRGTGPEAFSARAPADRSRAAAMAGLKLQIRDAVEERFFQEPQYRSRPDGGSGGASEFRNGGGSPLRQKHCADSGRQTWTGAGVPGPHFGFWDVIS